METDVDDKKLKNWGSNYDEEEYLQFHCGYQNDKKDLKYLMEDPSIA